MRLIFAVVFTVFLVGIRPVFAEDPAQQFEGFNLQGYSNTTGEKTWDVKGERADIQGDTIKMTNVDANQYGENEVNLKAKDGVVDKTSGNVHLENDVVITSKTGTQLKTDSLDWHKEKDMVTTAAPVELTDKGVKITGTGLEAQPGLKTAEMKKDVTVEVEPDKQDEDPITITCDGPLEVEQKENRAVFNNNVVAVQVDRTLKTDRMEVYFDAVNKKIQKMVCIGHVVLIQGDNVTQADQAVYDAVAQKVTLSGRPKLILIPGGENSLSSLAKKDKKEEKEEPATK